MEAGLRPEAVRADVIVIGGGMAGVSAALAAAEAGAGVAVIECDAAPGGSARLSSGRIWSFSDYDSLRARIPLGDARLQRVLSAGLAGCFGWLAGSVGHLAPQAAGKPGTGCVMQLGRLGDRTEYIAAMAAAAERRGAVFHFGCRATGMERMAAGFSVDVQPLARQARVRTFEAQSVIFATGGFQGDADLVADFIGPNARRAMLRSNPYSRGDGFRLARAAGGSVSRGAGSFYGKTMPLFAEKLPPSEYKRATLDIAKSSLAVDREGRRFADETLGIAGEGLANAALQQEDGRYFIILDAEQADEVRESLRFVAAAAGVAESEIFIEAASAASLGEAMQDRWSVPAQRIAECIAEARRAAEADDGRELTPPRARAPSPLQGKVAAVACQVAITLPFCGLHVDEDMQILAADGGPVEGLFAAGADAGGVYFGAYGGGLAWALVSGWTAGRSAASLRGAETGIAAE